MSTLAKIYVNYVNFAYLNQLRIGIYIAQYPKICKIEDTENKSSSTYVMI